MIEFLVFDKDDIEKLANNKIVNADIGRPIVCCSREYFELQRKGLQEGEENEQK